LKRAIVKPLFSAAIVAHLCSTSLTLAGEPEFRLLELDGQKVSWAVPAKGLPPVVTYALIAKTQTFVNARNCGGMLPPERALEPSHITRPNFIREVRIAFEMWERVTQIDFQETSDPSKADILIGAQAEPRGRAFTNVARRDGDNDARGEIQQSLICLNPDVRWKIGFDGNLDVYDLRYTIAHEIGHAIGLDHPGRDGQLMSYRYAETSRELREGDIKGAVEIYGSRTPSSLAARAFARGPKEASPRNRAADATVAQSGAPAPAPAHRQKALGLDTADR
jgi:hypothetical protein